MKKKIVSFAAVLMAMAMTTTSAFAVTPRESGDVEVLVHLQQAMQYRFLTLQIRVLKLQMATLWFLEDYRPKSNCSRC